MIDLFMEKIVVLMWKTPEVAVDALRRQLLDELASKLLSAGVKNLRVCVADSDVEAASANRISSISPPLDAMLSFWVDTAGCYAPVLHSLIDQYAERTCSYLVTESEPIVNTEYPTSNGVRTPGMNQVVVLKKPEKLDYAAWIELWLNQHTPIAIETQSTFGYRQNVICRHLLSGQAEYDAVVEENFPPLAMHDRQAFFAAAGDEALYKQREQRMLESCARFIDFANIDCIPMSEYNFYG